MKICLATRCFDFRNAGLGRVSSEIRKELELRGYEPYCISSNPDMGMSLYSYFWYTAWKIRRQLPKDSDVYHALTPMEAIWTPKEKTIVTFHDLFTLTDADKVGGGLGYSSVKRKFGSWYFNQACKKAMQSRYIACVSEKTKQEIYSIFELPEDKIRVIRSGISPNLEPQPKPDNIFRVGYLGGLDRRKRVNFLIDAFKQSGIDGELVIGGIGLDERMLKAQANGNKRIKFLGLVPDEQLPSFYNSLSVFVFPSSIEGYGLPIIEAMACKKPVIVMTDAKIPEEIKSRCYCTDNAESLLNLQKLSSVMDTHSVFDLVIEDNYFFAKEHSWKSCVDEYIKLYEEIANE